MRVSHELLKQNMIYLKTRLVILLSRARELNLTAGEEISLEIAHKIRQIDGIILTLNDMGSHENGIQFTDLYFIARQLRHQYHQMNRRLASFYDPLLFSEKAVKRSDENFTRS